MDIKEKKKILSLPEYAFLKTEERLKDNIMLLGLGGSHSYGTNVPTSDIDVRGISRNMKEDLLGCFTHQRENLTDNMVYIDKATDTTVYTLNHAVPLLANCNPNMVELLGLRKEDYFLIDPVGKRLIAEQQMFYSRKAQFAFGGYATAQLRRLQNALARDAYPKEEKQRHILGSLENTISGFNDRYAEQYGVTVAIKDGELVTSMNLKNYPLRDTYAMFSEMKAVVREYDHLNHRNHKKDDAHLNKHAMHLVRLLYTGTELLETGIMHTYREKEHDLLMNIRNGKFQKSDHSFDDSFFEMVDDLETKFKYAAEHSVLPEKADMKRINEFVMDVNTDTVIRSKKIDLTPEFKKGNYIKR